MFSALCKFILNIWGWQIVGNFPDLKKYIIIVAPHTSNWDFLIGVLVRGATKLKANFLGKSGLFKPPLGFIFRKLGGHPVERSKQANQVEKVIDIFNKNDEFRLALAPEGTRKKVKEWKTGFYYIANGAEVPILMAAMDYSKNEVVLSEPFYTSGNIEQDLPKIKEFYKDKKGKHQ